MGRPNRRPLHFPLLGLDKKTYYQTQRPYTTPDCENVRPDVGGISGRRERGGSRPAFIKASATQVGAEPVRLIGELDYLAKPGATLTNKLIVASGGAIKTGSLASLSAAAGLGTGQAKQMDGFERAGGRFYFNDLADPSLTGSAGTIGEAVSGGVEFSDTGVDFNNTDDIDEEMLIIESEGDGVNEIQTLTITATGGNIRLSLDTEEYTDYIPYNSSAAIFQAALRGLKAIGKENVDVTGSGPYTITFEDDLGSTNVETLTLDTDELTGGSATMAVHTPGSPGKAQIGAVCRINSISSTTKILIAPSPDPTGITYNTGTVTVASGVVTLASGTFPNWAASGSVVVGSDTYTVNTRDSDTQVTLDDLTVNVGAGASYVIKLYGTNVKWRIQRCPKYVDMSIGANGTVKNWEPDPGKGWVPVGSPFCLHWRDRAIMIDAGFPHVLRGSRQGNMHDWILADEEDDLGRPFAFTSEDTAGEIDKPLVGGMTWTDDCLIAWTRTTTLVCRGDPATGVTHLETLHDGIGIMSAHAWCQIPELRPRGGSQSYRVVFLSYDGLYMMAGQCASPPFSISDEKLPAELKSIDTDTFEISMEYDYRHRGIHLFITEEGQLNSQWWIDIQNTLEGNNISVTFWPVKHNASTDEVMYAKNFFGMVADGDEDESFVLCGCDDGYLRQYTYNSTQDDDTHEIVSYVDIGPVPMSPFGDLEGMFTELEAIAAKSSGDIKWELYVGETAEGVALQTSSPFATGTWSFSGSDTRTPRAAPRAAGNWFKIRLKNGAANTIWAIEGLFGSWASQTGKTRKI